MVAKVFMVGGYETTSGKPEVIWSKTGNLNSGTTKIFQRQPEAIAFAKRKAVSLGEGTTLTLDIRGGAKAYVVSGGSLTTHEPKRAAPKKSAKKAKKKSAPRESRNPWDIRIDF